MIVHCPHCQNHVEVEAEATLVDVNCPTCGSTFSLFNGKSTAPLFPGGRQSIGHFHLLRELGVGQFGAVWLANDTRLDRTVAIKIPRREQLALEEVDRFFREARAAAQLRHPNIVSVHEVGRDGETAYIVSDFVDGANLKEWLSGQRLSARESAELVCKVAAALDHAHRAGIIHRDVKPANIILDTDGEPHVTDFGLALRVSGEVTMTLEGQIVGTPSYMSPEQAGGKGHEADARSDIYSLGVILFELLTGELPFRGDREMLLLQIRRDEPPRPRKLNHHIPRDLETICLKCLEKVPAHRYESAQHAADDLKRFLNGEPILARPVGRAVRAWRWSGRNLSVASLGAAVVLLLLAVTLGSIVAAVRIASARDEAERSAKQERVARGEAETNLAEAERQRTHSEESFRQARQTVDEYFTAVSADPSLSAAAFEPLRKRLLESAMQYHERFVREHGHDPAVRAELAASHFRVATINQTLALDWVSAMKNGLAVLKELVDDDAPLAELGSLRNGLKQGGRNNVVIADLAEAIATATEFVRLYGILVAQFPEVSGFRSDLAIGSGSLGVMLRRAGRLDEALRSFEREESVYAPLIESASSSPDHLYAHSNNVLQKARTVQAAGRPDDAELTFRQAIATYQRVTPSYARWQDVRYNLACARRDLAYLVWKSVERRNEAEAELRLAVETFDDLTESYPDVTVFRFDAAVNHDALGQMLEWDRENDAEAEYRTALGGLEKLMVDFPDQAEFANKLGTVLDALAELVRKQGRKADALVLAKRKSSIDERHDRGRSGRSPHGPQQVDDRTWLLAVFGESQLQNPKRAVQMAKRALEVEPINPRYWSALGVAQYRLGNWDNAIAALSKSVALSFGGNDVEWFFLGMAYFKTDDAEKGRMCFEQAVNWMEKHHPNNADVSQIRSEAAQLLGITDQVISKQPSSGSWPTELPPALR